MADSRSLVGRMHMDCFRNVWKETATVKMRIRFTFPLEYKVKRLPSSLTCLPETIAHSYTAVEKLRIDSHNRLPDRPILNPVGRYKRQVQNEIICVPLRAFASFWGSSGIAHIWRLRSFPSKCIEQQRLTVTAESDLDELVRNSWSAKRDLGNRAEMAKTEADLDELVRNSWSA